MVGPERQSDLLLGAVEENSGMRKRGQHSAAGSTEFSPPPQATLQKLRQVRKSPALAPLGLISVKP